MSDPRGDSAAAEGNGGKGKGKATTASDAVDTQASSAPRQSTLDSDGARTNSHSGGATQSLASLFRSSMVSSQLGSLLHSASGGKAELAPSSTASGSNAELRDWLVQDLQSASPSTTSGAEHPTARQSFRSSPGQSSNPAHSESLYRDFQQGLSLHETTSTDFAQRQLVTDHVEGLNSTLDHAWSRQYSESQQTSRNTNMDWDSTGLRPDQIRPIHSYTDLDAPMHQAVQSSQRHSTQTFPGSLNVEQQPSSAGAQTNLASSSTDIFALLDAEEQSQGGSASAYHPVLPLPARASPQPAASSEEEILSHFDSTYQPPSPSNAGFSREQAAMHLALAEAQASQQGLQELLIPRPDNPEIQEGVYAPTAAQALESILSGRTESQTVKEAPSTSIPSSSSPAVVEKITTYFGRSTYLDDVYGLPPLLTKTIEQASALADDAKTEESRQIAIRRLESLWNHITNTAPRPSSAASAPNNADWVDGWLRSNT